MKYGELTLGQIEALVNKLGGIVGVKRLLADELIVSEKEAPKDLFKITVDYCISFNDMVSAGKYDWINSGITDKHFPNEKRGKEEIEIQLVHFNRAISSGNAIAELDKMGLRPANLEELLVFGAKHPDEQGKYPIVALGSVWRAGFGDRTVPYLWSNAHARRLDLDWAEPDWSSDDRFLAVRK